MSLLFKAYKWSNNFSELKQALSKHDNLIGYWGGFCEVEMIDSKVIISDSWDSDEITGQDYMNENDISFLIPNQ